MKGRTVHLNDTEPVVTGGEGAFASKGPSVGTLPIDSFDDDTAPGGPLSENILGAGRVVDRYRIVRLIASGGTARVYEAVHVFTQRPVALKVMHHRLANRPDIVEGFRNEATALSSIRHDNVVYVENAGLTEDGHVFIAMDLLNGKNLREILNQVRRLELHEAMKLVAEVADGVAAAHAIKVIHRDLKPENIFCVKGGPAKVLDLGTAKFAGNNAPTTQTARGKVTGTAAYIAPERLEGEPGDERSDIYALGLVLYECIAGFHPLAPTGNWPNAAEIAARQVTCHPKPIPGLAPDVWSIIAKATQKKPERRYQSMRELRSALRDLSARPKGARAPMKVAPIKSNWASLGLPIVAGIIVGSSLSGVVFRFRHSPPVESGVVKPQIPPTPASVIPVGAVPDPPSTRAIVASASMTASPPSRGSLPAEKSLMSTGISPVTGRTLAESAAKRSAPGSVVPSPAKPPSNGSKGTVAPVNSSNVPPPRTSNDVLPASGL